MNRRDFLSLFRLLAAIPFVKLPELPAATTEAVNDEEAAAIVEEYENVPSDDNFIGLGELNINSLDSFEYQLSTRGFKLSSSKPMTVFRPGDFVSIRAGKDLIFTGAVEQSSEYYLTLISPYSLISRHRFKMINLGLIDDYS